MTKLSYTRWFNKLLEIESQITSNNHKTVATVFTMFGPNSHVCTFTTSKICKYTPIFESASGEGGARTPTFGFPQERGSDYSPFYLNLAKLSDCPRPALKFNAWNPVPICCDTNICTSSALLAVYNNNAANIIPRAYLPPQQTNTRRPASSITRESAKANSYSEQVLGDARRRRRRNYLPASSRRRASPCNFLRQRRCAHFCSCDNLFKRKRPLLAHSRAHVNTYTWPSAVAALRRGHSGILALGRPGIYCSFLRCYQAICIKRRLRQDVPSSELQSAHL